MIVAPMITGGQTYPWQIRCRFRDRSGFVALDQLRTVDSERRVMPGTLAAVLAVLQEMFAP